MDETKLIQYATRIIIIFMCTPIHEFAHAWAATKLGDETPRYQGRLTLNPIAHIDPLGAVALFFAGFGWGKPVQVNSNRFKHYRRDLALTALAGPVSNFLLAFMGIIIEKLFFRLFIVNGDAEAVFNYALTGKCNDPLYYVSLIFFYFTAVNIGLAVFNLIPIFPLDGEKILNYFTGKKFDAFMRRNQLYITIGFVVLLVSGLLNRPLGWVQGQLYDFMDFLTGWADSLFSAIIK
ncbi:MAG: site-2 protease family protein [Ruminococcus sp.]|nr:site-2 protease family protein [Ruminococcus sp.]